MAGLDPSHALHMGPSYALNVGPSHALHVGRRCVGPDGRDCLRRRAKVTPHTMSIARCEMNLNTSSSLVTSCFKMLPPRKLYTMLDVHPPQSLPLSWTFSEDFAAWVEDAREVLGHSAACPNFLIYFRFVMVGSDVRG